MVDRRSADGRRANRRGGGSRLASSLGVSKAGSHAGDEHVAGGRPPAVRPATSVGWRGGCRTERRERFDEARSVVSGGGLEAGRRRRCETLARSFGASPRLGSNARGTSKWHGIGSPVHRHEPDLRATGGAVFGDGGTRFTGQRSVADSRGLGLYDLHCAESKAAHRRLSSRSRCQFWRIRIPGKSRQVAREWIGNSACSGSRSSIFDCRWLGARCSTAAGIVRAAVPAAEHHHDHQVRWTASDQLASLFQWSADRSNAGVGVAVRP